jgi:hypothetical protein
VGDGEYSRQQKPRGRQIRRDRDEPCTAQQEPDDRAGEVRAGQAEGWRVAHGAKVILNAFSRNCTEPSLARTSHQLHGLFIWQTPACELRFHLE